MGRNSFDDKNNKTPWGKIIIFVLILFVIICVIYYYLSKDGNALENSLLRSAKEYYSSEDVLLPEAEGECGVVMLSTLESNGYITNTKKFEECNMSETYVKVCKLGNGNYQYVPVYDCGSLKTNFSEWKNGSFDDLEIDKSDVRFSFLPQEYSSKEKKYYPSDKDDSSNVSEYYISAPKKEYSYKDSSTQASKWYVEQTGTTYWNNGAYSSTQPNGYANKGNEKTVSYISLTKPTIANYRTINQVTLYRTKQVVKAHIYGYFCTTRNASGGIFKSNIPCDERTDDYTVFVVKDPVYTCDDVNTSKKDDVCESKILGDWSQNKCSTSGDIVCETTAGYQYTDKQWQWYTTGTYRKYYPSGATTASGENTYYVSAPVSGAKQDTSTITTVYKFYKLVDGKSENGTWVDLSNNYLTEEELINIFKQNKYEVNSLSDILNNKNINYSINMEYANRE